MNRVIVSDPRHAIRTVLVDRLSVAGLDCAPVATGDESKEGALGAGAVVYHPPERSRRAAVPDLGHAERMFARATADGVGHFVLLSSTAAYGANPHNPGLIGEDKVGTRQRKNRIACSWLELEAAARHMLGSRLTILRTATVPVADDYGPLRGLFHRWIARRVLGHDPSVQLLSPEDLAEAVRRAIETREPETFNVVPSGVMPLRQAMRLAGTIRLPICGYTQKAARAVLSRVRLSTPADRTDYLRYNWTASGAKAADRLGFTPQRSTAEALADCRLLETGRRPRRWAEYASRTFDDFGFDPAYHRRVGRTIGRFLEKVYWRCDVRGLEQIPRDGPAVLIGVHRGFMPFDGVLFSHQVTRAAGRTPRFLIHPGLVKFPGLHDFMTKQCGVIATGENADYALQRGELLALFPEGVRGPFRAYREAYTLGKFGRDEYVRMAIRNRAPIIPFVTVGSAEIFPILARIEWGWWKRTTEWPCLPITPTFPLLPVPLPSKWHTLVLDPIRVDQEYPAEAADDDALVRRIGEEVRQRMQDTLTRMRARRPSVFFGALRAEEPAVPPAGVIEAVQPQVVGSQRF
jgi:1-acyl-sn-glycerol-3-phosphate acyltransferase/nucleoside-diphosphate-sugar epimerase